MWFLMRLALLIEDGQLFSAVGSDGLFHCLTLKRVIHGSCDLAEFIVGVCLGRVVIRVLVWFWLFLDQ